MKERERTNRVIQLKKRDFMRKEMVARENGSENVNHKTSLP